MTHRKLEMKKIVRKYGEVAEVLVDEDKYYLRFDTGTIVVQLEEFEITREQFSRAIQSAEKAGEVVIEIQSKKWRPPPSIEGNPFNC